MDILRIYINSDGTLIIRAPREKAESETEEEFKAAVFNDPDGIYEGLEFHDKTRNIIEGLNMANFANWRFQNDIIVDTTQ